MIYLCKSFDKIFKDEIEEKYFESKCHKFFDEFTITRYIVENPNINIFSDKMKKYVDIPNKK